MNLTLVIVNWNAGRQLADCVASIAAAAAPLARLGWQTHTVVVDNGSSDDSVAHLPEHPTLTVLRNPHNRGFAAACNQGAAAAPDSDLLLFLNPDTRLEPDSLIRPVQALAENACARIGIVGIQMVDERGQVARSCARFPRASQFLAQALGFDRLWPASGHAMREWDHGQTRPVDQVIGAFFMIRGPLFRQLGGFDERFFVYFEEVDLALRARQAGWPSLFLAEARAFHKGGGTTDQVRGKRLFYSWRSRLAYFRKHGSAGDRLLIGAVTWLLEPLARLVQLTLAGRFDELRHLAEAYRLLLRDRIDARSQA